MPYRTLFELELPLPVLPAGLRFLLLWRRYPRQFRREGVYGQG